jgi:hypothetical protein
MATLTILYSILFFLLRARTKSLLNASTTTDQQTVDDLTTTTNTQWEVRFTTSDDDPEASPARPSGPVIVTKSVSIYTEALPNPPPPPQCNANARRTYDRMNKVSVVLLIYPILYVIVTMPIVINRVAQFAGQEFGLTFAYFGATLFQCTGWINVLLYTSTRKGLISWNRLKFWKRDVNDLRPSRGRTGRRSARATLENEMVNFDSVQRAQITSKQSASSTSALKEEI